MSFLGDKPKAIILVGPTSSGKTQLSIQLAQALNSEIISLDASQIYKDLRIGTGTPSEYDLIKVKHHLVGIYPPNTKINAAKVSDQAYEIAQLLYTNKKIPVVVGGSYLYVKFFVHGYIKDQEGQFFAPEASWDLLATLDPEYAKAISRNDTVRIRRALEFKFKNKKTYSETIRMHNFASVRIMPLFVALIWDRKQLYARIESRCKDMIENGLLAEAIRVAKIYGEDSWGLKKSIGYDYMLKLQKGEIGIDSAFKAFVRETKRFARQQSYYLIHEPKKRKYKILPDCKSCELDSNISFISVGTKKILCYEYSFNRLLNLINEHNFDEPTFVYVSARCLLEKES